MIQESEFVNPIGLCTELPLNYSIRTQSMIRALDYLNRNGNCYICQQMYVLLECLVIDLPAISIVLILLGEKFKTLQCTAPKRALQHK